MAKVKTVRGDDGKPYISLEDFIDEIKTVKIELEERDVDNVMDDAFIIKLLKTLTNMEIEYYEKFLFRK